MGEISQLGVFAGHLKNLPIVNLIKQKIYEKLVFIYFNEIITFNMKNK